MKYLVSYNNYSLLLEEADVKWSKSLYDELIKLHSETQKEVDKLNPQDFFGKLKSVFTKKSLNDIITKDEVNELNVIKHRLRDLTPSAKDILYDNFKIKLGCSILKIYCDWNDKTEFALKRASYNIIPDNVIDSISKSIENKSLDELLQKSFNDAKISFAYIPTFDSQSQTKGALHKFKRWFHKEGTIVDYEISLNTFYPDFEKTIRHELQHLTQKLNTFCLNVGEFVIKNWNYLKNQSDYKLLASGLSGVYTKSFNTTKVGTGRTKTGLKQSEENVGDIERHFQNYAKRKINKNSETDKELASTLRYLLDDNEYKPWLSDKVQKIIDYWKSDFAKEQLKKYKENPKSIDRSKIIKAMTTALLEKDFEIGVIKSSRKEVGSDIYKLISQKVDEYFDEK